MKVAQLRGILSEYEIAYPSNAKKGELVKLFNEDVKPRAAEHLRVYEQSVKNLNDVGFIDAATDKTLRRAKKSASAEADEGKVRKKKTKAKKQPALSDESHVESEPEEGDSKKTAKKAKDKKKPKAPQSDDEDTEVTKTASKLTAKDEGPFSSDNVFQSPPSSSSKPKKSPKSTASPSVSKKRHRDDDDKELDIKKKPKVPKSPLTVKPTNESPAKKGHLFDDQDSSDSGSDIFSKSIISQVKSPKVSKIKKPTSKKSTPVTDKRTPMKKDTPENSSPLKSIKQEKVSDTPVSKQTPLKHSTPSTKSSVKKASSARSDKSDISFISFTEEQGDFEKERKKIKSKRGSSTPSKTFDTLSSADLASQLGITIQGLPPKGFQLSDKSFAGIKGEHSEKKSSPYSRKYKQNITQPSLDEVSDNEAEDVEKDTLDKVQEGIEHEMDKLNEIVEKSSTIKKPSLINIFSFIGLWLVLLSIGLSTYWYREQTYLIGYCGQEINQSTIPHTSELPAWLIQLGSYMDNNFKPQCTKCPAHARCYPYLEIGCYEDFVEHKPWYFDILPVANPSLKKCVPDTKKAEKLEIMIDVALDLLRSKNAEKNCGNTSLEKVEAGLSSDELHDLLLLMKAPYITNEEFEELWGRSVIELKKEPEVIVRQVIFFLKENHSLVFNTELLTLKYRLDSGLGRYYQPLTLTTRERRKSKTKFFDQRPYRTLV